MKKVLLGTSAIALAGAFASQANAAEWNMRVGGYLEEQMVYTNTDDSRGGKDYNGIDNISDGEIHFSPQIVLDNGIKFGARIELEGATNSDQVDENYAYVEGSFGRLELGEDDNVAYKMAYAAPDVSFYGINSGSDTLSIPFAANFGTTSTYPFIESDSAGIRYFTPRLAGFQIGASYARDANKSTNDANQDENKPDGLFNVWAVAANYVNTFGEVSVAASGGYTRGSRNGSAPIAAANGMYLYGSGFGFDFDHLSTYSCANGDNGLSASHIENQHVVTKKAVCAADGTSDTNPEAWQLGLNVGFGGFTVGGSYAKYDNGGPVADRYVWDVGASYETGPWGFSATYLHSKAQESTSDVTDGDKIDKFIVAGTYTVAKGVRVGAFGVYENLDYDSGGSDDAFVIGTGMRLDF